MKCKTSTKLGFLFTGRFRFWRWKQSNDPVRKGSGFNSDPNQLSNETLQHDKYVIWPCLVPHLQYMSCRCRWHKPPVETVLVQARLSSPLHFPDSMYQGIGFRDPCFVDTTQSRLAACESTLKAPSSSQKYYCRNWSVAEFCSRSVDILTSWRFTSFSDLFQPFFNEERPCPPSELVRSCSRELLWCPYYINIFAVACSLIGRKGVGEPWRRGRFNERTDTFELHQM